MSESIPHNVTGRLSNIHLRRKERVDDTGSFTEEKTFLLTAGKMFP